MKLGRHGTTTSGERLPGFWINVANRRVDVFPASYPPVGVGRYHRIFGWHIEWSRW